MLYSVQFLRGLAALLVVISHIVNKEIQNGICKEYWFSIGKTGIDLFFIISGFIICYTTHNKKILFKCFVKRRVERIIPLYWFFTTLALILYLMPFKVFYASADTFSILDSYFLLPFGKNYLVGTGWTLRYEFYFYFLFALFLLIPIQSYFRYLGIIFLIAFLTCFGWFFGKQTPLVEFVLSHWLMEFVWGIIAFVIYKNIKFSLIPCVVMIVSGLFILLYQNFKSDIIYSQYRVFYSGIPMFLIFIGFLHLEKNFKTSKNYLLSFIERLGNSSYSLYLTHPFALVVMSYICVKLHITIPLFFFLGLFFSSVLFGFFTYQFIERPMLKWIRTRF